MRGKCINNFVLLLFIACAQFATPLFADDSIYTEKHVLVLHSYHQGLDWTDNITEGIQSVLKSRKDINLVFEYLDFKRNYNIEHYDALLNLYKKKAKQIPFSAIIVSDNFAFDFMQKHAKEYYPGIPVFYCGVNNLEKEQLVDYPNFYGTKESIDYAGTLNTIVKVFPDRKNILVVCDNTLTGKAVQAELKKVISQFKDKLNFEYASDISLDELKNKVGSLNSTYVVYLLFFNRDKNGVYISYRNGLKHLKTTCNVPIFGSWDFYMTNGLFGGKITQGYDQGTYAATLAKRFLDGESFDTIPQIRNSVSKAIFNYEELQRFDIERSMLPEGSVIINMPPEKERLIRIFFILTVSFGFIVILLLIRLQLKKNRADQLEQTIKERTSELTKSNTELQNIIEKKDKFFSILAHDLKNSIGGMFSFTKLLNERGHKISKETLTDIYLSLSTAASKTYNMLEDLLYWGKRQFNNEIFLDHKDFNINNLLEKIADDFEMNQNEVTIELDFDKELTINSDYEICKFIFRNLIQNAVKFCHKGGAVQVKTRQENNRIKVMVTDNGIGMSENVVESIYLKKPIIKASPKGDKGTGLGLPCVVDYVKLLNAELKIKSKENEGSTFSVIFL